jgi:hypothetical protein
MVMTMSMKSLKTVWLMSPGTLRLVVGNNGRGPENITSVVLQIRIGKVKKNKPDKILETIVHYLFESCCCNELCCCNKMLLSYVLDSK